MGKTVKKYIGAAAAVMIIFFIVAGAMHAHADGLEHNDCSVCVIVSHAHGAVHAASSAAATLFSDIFGRVFIYAAIFAGPLLQQGMAARAPPFFVS
ncbi:MAG: hypothetical protein OEV59_07195 [Deltaproteobacteria bacterium]|nr:hypothetical protein [Deltaproteobacteria bacterium]